MNIQELGEQYREKTDEELLRLALAREQLTPEANLALTGELARRVSLARRVWRRLRKMSKSAKLKMSGASAHLAFFTFLALVVSGLEMLIASTIPKPV